MSTNLLIKNQELFDRNNIEPLLDKNRKSRAITIDGPTTDQFITATPRILWILREVHGAGKNRSLINDINKDLIGRDKPFWPRWYSSWSLVIKVSHAILDNNMIMSNKSPKSLKKSLERIAVINLNKFGGGSKKSEHYWEGAKKCKDLVKSQYELFSPDIVIFGGTGQDFVDLDIANLGIKEFSSHKNRFPSLKKDRVTFISAYHPGQRSLSHFAYCDNIFSELKS